MAGSRRRGVTVAIRLMIVASDNLVGSRNFSMTASALGSVA
jgi:hypothetical protein